MRKKMCEREEFEVREGEEGELRSLKENEGEGDGSSNVVNRSSGSRLNAVSSESRNFSRVRRGLCYEKEKARERRV